MVKRYIPMDGPMVEASEQGYESCPRYVFEGDYAALEQVEASQSRMITELDEKLAEIEANNELLGRRNSELLTIIGQLQISLSIAEQSSGSG